MKELKLTPREYQSAIYKTCEEKDCLVVLPTGTGKTLLALMLAITRFKKHPLQKILILAPTKPLIEQHFMSFQKNLPEDWADMQLFTSPTGDGRSMRIRLGLWNRKKKRSGQRRTSRRLSFAFEFH